MTAATAHRVDGVRLLQRLDDLARIGAIPGTTGNSRLALTDEDRDGRDLVVTWMRDLGLQVTIDGIGNIVGCQPDHGGRAPVMCGSHIDTVARGGRYDGNLGVLAGLEVIERVMELGIETSRPLAVASFTDEEGARFPPDMLGSLVYVGGLPLESALDIHGVDGAVLGDELERIGYAGSAPCPGRPPAAFVELHIEQGPILDIEDITIGVVESVQGISWQELRIEGQSNHAGTTPMHLRRDAGYAAARITTFVRELAGELGGHQVGTVGVSELSPGLVNVVAGSSLVTVDLRNTDEQKLREAERRLAQMIEHLAADEHVEISHRSLARFEPVPFDPKVVDLVESTARSLGHRTRRLPSGAGHDAQMLARVCPTAMVFTKSRDGVSHNPAEHTEPEDLVAGADVLLNTMLRLADDPDLHAEEWSQ
ncbi:MAG: Zn-dependent hydrolase [Actinomycetota bacterium]|nr:Zn-dependent hydrolase [Actinomycetota bacterium]